MVEQTRAQHLANTSLVELPVEKEFALCVQRIVKQAKTFEACSFGYWTK